MEGNIINKLHTKPFLIKQKKLKTNIQSISSTHSNAVQQKNKVYQTSQTDDIQKSTPNIEHTHKSIPNRLQLMKALEQKVTRNL